MPNQPETNSYDTNVVEWQTTDALLAGRGNIMNSPLLSLSNRTKYLKAFIDGLIAGTSSPISAPAGSTAVTQSAGNSTNLIADTAFVQQELTERAGIRNLVINGSMKICQRSMPIVVNPNNYLYTLDRWIVGVDNSGARTATVTQDTSVSVITFPGIKAALKAVVTAGANVVTIRHRIANALTMAGQQVNLSFKVSSSIAQSCIATINVYKTSASAASRTADGGAGSATSALTAGGAQTFSYNFVMPDLSAQAGTMDSGGCVEIVFQMGSTSGYTVYLSQVQFETGEIASIFENMPHGLELSECKRYFEVLTPLINDDGAYVSAYTHYARVPYATEKRTTPTTNLTVTPVNAGMTAQAVATSDKQGAVVSYSITTYAVASARTDQYRLEVSSEL